jgi:hypothetical protein
MQWKGHRLQTQTMAFFLLRCGLGWGTADGGARSIVAQHPREDFAEGARNEDICAHLIRNDSRSNF